MFDNYIIILIFILTLMTGIASCCYFYYRGLADGLKQFQEEHQALLEEYKELLYELGIEISKESDQRLRRTNDT